jgi:acid phosphatase
VTVAGAWARSFLEPLLADQYFNANRTLIVLTFDERENYFTLQNRVFTVLLGSAIGSDLVGTTNSTRFSHYSLTKTAEVNWDLPSLTDHDAEAIPFL